MRVVGHRHPRPGLLGDGPALGDQVVSRLQRTRRADAHVHAQLGADQQQAVAHVVAGVADIGIGDLLQRLVGVLHHGQRVGQHLGGVPVVGEAVVDRHPGKRGKLLDHGLLGAAILDRVEEPPQHPRRVLDGLLVADLRGLGLQEGGGRPLVGCGHLERGPGAGGGFLKDQRDVAAREATLLGPCSLGSLEFGGQVEQVSDLLRTLLDQAQQAAAPQVNCHLVFLPCVSPVLACSGSDAPTLPQASH